MQAWFSASFGAQARIAAASIRSALILLGLLLAIPSGAAEIAFTSKFVAHPVTVAPGEMVAGDFDEDGRNEIALMPGVTGSPPWVTILRSTPGGWSPLTSVSTGVGPIALVAADLDADGHLDLATANYGSSSVSVMRGLGNGTFQAKVGYATVSGPRSIAAGDVTGDGVLDLVTASGTASSISVLPGNGAGGFLARVDRASGAELRDVRLHDFDGDGRDDVIVLSRSGNSLLIHRSLGNGALDLAIAYGGLTNPEGMAVADFDQDGRMDVVVSQGVTPALAYLRGGAGLVLEAPVAIPLSGAAARVIAGRADPDAKLDLVATVGSSLVLLRGQGDGTFAAPAGTAAGAGAGEVILAELDGDPALEIGVGCGGVVNLSQYDVGEAGVIGSVTPEDELAPANGLALVQADANGPLDLVQVAGDLLQVRPGLGGGDFEAPITLSSGMDINAGGHHGPESVELGRLSGNGLPDIVGLRRVDFQIQAVILRGNGGAANGGFDAPSLLGMVPNDSRLACVSDVDADGRDDVLVGAYWPTSLVLFRQVAGGTYVRTDYSLPSPENWAGGAFRSIGADVNGDSVRDILMSHDRGIAYLPGLGNGSFGSAVFVDGLPALIHRSITFADLDEDGWMDVLGTSPSTPLGYWLRGTGAGTFVVGTSFTLAGTAEILQAHDVDVDGWLDVLAPIPAASCVSVFRAQGNGAFDPGRHLGAAGATLAVAVGDLDGDAWPELMAGGTTSTVVLRNRTALVGVPPTAPATPTHGLALSSPFPNPMSGLARIDLSLPDGRPAQFQVVDLRGRIVHRVEIAGGTSDARRVDLALPRHLPPGLYFGRLVHPLGSRSTKLVLQR